MNVEGKAVLGCTVTIVGELKDCVVNSEEPEGMGFGDAALRLSKLFKMHPAKATDGTPTEGHINIPIRFQLPKK
jgi:protein TonB